MAIRTDPKMFSGGAVVFNQQPLLNLYAQVLAKRQAKNEALDEYYKKLPSTINAAGMRDQSIPGFNEAVGKAQEYWMQNRDAIRKGNTPEAFNYDKMFREIQGKVQEDKNAAKTDLELGKMRFSGENQHIFDDPDFIDALHQHNLSVFDPGHKQMDLGTVAVPPKPFDMAAQDKYWKSLTSGMEPGKKYDYSKAYTSSQTGQVIVPTIDVFNDDQIKKIAEKAKDIVSQDKSAKLYYDKILSEPNSEAWQALQKEYSKYFDGVVSTPEQAAAADAILKASVPKKYAEEQEQNYGQKYLDSLHKLAVQNAYILGRRGGSGETTTQFNIDNYEREGNWANITVPMQGYTVTAIGKDKLLAKKVLFNPETQQVKVTEYVGRDKEGNPTGQKESTLSLNDFLQNVRGNNPQADMRFLETLKNIKGYGTQQKPPKAEESEKPSFWKSKTKTTKSKKDPLGIL